MAGGVLYRFGPFELNTAAQTLLRDGAQVALADRHVAVLSLLLEHAGAVVTKDQIMAAGWNVIVGENSIEKVMSDLRLALGAKPDGGPHVETLRRRGYRFEAERSREEIAGQPYEARLALLQRWTGGRAALETLRVEQVRYARGLFEELARSRPDHAPAHVGLATACIMQFEATRADADPDRAALETALRHAREARRLDPRYGEALATLAFVLSRTGAHAEALLAALEATELEPDNWRHHARHAIVTWGPDRLRAARRALAIAPGLPLGHLLAATVLIPRQALDEAAREVAAGVAAQEAQSLAGPRFGSVGLHWLSGLLLFQRGDDAGAVAGCERELSFLE